MNPNFVEHLLDELPRLREPLGEEGVGVDLHQVCCPVPFLQSDGELLSQSLTEAGLPSSRRTVQQNHSVAGDDVRVHRLVRQDQGGLHKPQQVALDVRIIDEVFPDPLELPVRHHPVVRGRDLLLPLQADLLKLRPSGDQLVVPGQFFSEDHDSI